MRIISHRFLGIMLTLTMVLSMVPVFSVTARAAEGYVASVKVGEAVKWYQSINTAVTDWYNTSDSALTLFADAQAYVPVPEGGTRTLDLNGYVLDGAGNSNGVINNYGTLTVIDSTPNTEHYFTYAKDKAWSYISKPTSEQKNAAVTIGGITDSTTVVKVLGGVITGGCRRDSHGGGVFLNKNTTFTMTGGTICGNTAKQGGGLYTGSGTKVSLINVDIVGNYGTENAGGAMLNANGDKTTRSFTFGGTVRIFGNTSLGDPNLTFWDAANAPITIDTKQPLTYDSKIYVILRNNTDFITGPVTEPTNNDYSSCFVSDVAKYDIANEGTGSNQVVKVVDYHVHKWIYGVKAGTTDTLQATCAGIVKTHEGKNPEEITIIKPELTTYGGIESAKATLSETTLGGLQVSADAIEYEGVSPTIYSKSKIAPTAAGIYRASITVDANKTAYVEYTIAGKAITVTDSEADNKSYDGTTAASVKLGKVEGIITGDAVTVSAFGEFTDKNAEKNKVVKITYTLTGPKAGNYSVTGNEISAADIAPRVITVTDTAADGKTYDGTTAASVKLGKVEGIITGDAVTVSAFGAFTDKNAGNGKNVKITYAIAGASAGNYNVSGNVDTVADIEKKELMISEAAIENKTYDGTKNATVTAVTFSGLVSGEALTKETDYTLSGEFDNTDAAGANAATKVTVKAVLNDTENAKNYTISGPKDIAGTINKADQPKTSSAPALASKTDTMISIKDVTVEGETVEYAKNTTNTAPESGWQTDTKFSSLSPSTTYYIFSRVKENNNYKPGVASAALQEKTNSSTPGSGGGGSSATTYKINNSDAVASGGSVTLSTKEAAAGYTATITVKAEAGYKLKTLSVKTSEGKDVSVKTVTTGSAYSFVMPSSAVTVSAEFEPDNEAAATTADTTAASTAAISFLDVQPEDYYYDAVNWAVNRGITTGTDSTHFSPDDYLTRAQMVTFLWRLTGSPVVDYAMPFTDIPADAYYEEAVRWACSEGIAKGLTDTTFGPDQEVTRAQAATFIWRYADSPEPTAIKAYSDVLSDAYYYNAVQWATEKGITTGISEGVFAPDNSCTRAQIVTFLYRFMGN